jgi:signal peptidase I
MRTPTKPPRAPSPKTGVVRSIASRENIEAIVIAVVLALFIRTFVVQAFKIPSGSMEPTLLVGDHILVNKFIYGLSIPFTGKKFLQYNTPRRGDVIVFIYPVDSSKDFIKRVIGVEGDTIEIRNKQILINNAPYIDSHGVYSDERILREWDASAVRDNLGPLQIPPGQLFVMGDNRDKSYDSRFWGFVDSSKVRGKAFLIYWSWERAFHNFRLNRIGKVIN